ncbi:hypothetical protein BGZ61DRAFT_375668 [Ilyonectria robusta]|uniref:uncharacterized protein n=1 Tax=Ilyonectria robusta TaxID=1079257 RepID=UPI001E8CA900|nr:uncharacterized protein BGZ61DRAFT_375668 [Ilyonectria robusta]KAH8650679.1 hypothetical protein BGZ61DRAFT_375668 [Ilyonectria robusta]
MSKLVVIVGVTGNQGGSVADTFLLDPSWRVRAVTRDPSKSSAQEWAARGVELVTADQDDIDTLRAAFAGAHAIFTMTDFWTPLYDPVVRAAAAKHGIIAQQYCAELETQRGKNMAIAAAAPEVQKTLERFIYSSLPDATKLSGGKHKHVWHFDSKAAVEEFVRHNPAMVSAGLSGKASFIHVGLYVDNWRRSSMELQKDTNSDGYHHISTGDGHQKMPWVWTRRDTGPLVKKLVEDVRPGVRLLAYNEMISYKDFLAIWSRTLGTKLASDGGIKQVTMDEFAELIPGDEHAKEHMINNWEFLEELGYDGSNPEMLHPKDINAEHLLTTVEEYIKWDNWSPLIGEHQP